MITAIEFHTQEVQRDTQRTMTELEKQGLGLEAPQGQKQTSWSRGTESSYDLGLDKSLGNFQNFHSTYNLVINAL